MNREYRRKQKYEQLINSGFNSKYATRFKNFSQSLVNELCTLKLEAKKQTDAIELAVMERIQELLYRKGLKL